MSTGGNSTARRSRRLSTGIVTTTRVTHATPAVNYAHVASRDWEADSDLPAGATVRDIARQLLEFPYGDGPEVVLGVRPVRSPGPSGGHDM